MERRRRIFFGESYETLKVRQDIVTPSTSQQFPSSAYITHTISGYRSRLIPAGSLPWQPTIHHTFFFIKLIFFKKSRPLASLPQLRKSAPGWGGEERKIHLTLEDKMNMKIAWLKMIYIRTRHPDDITIGGPSSPVNNLFRRWNDRKIFRYLATRNRSSSALENGNF